MDRREFTAIGLGAIAAEALAQPQPITITIPATIEGRHNSIPIVVPDQASLLVIDGEMSAQTLNVRTIILRGKLTLEDNFSIKCETFYRLPGSELIGGTKTNPISGEFVFLDFPLNLTKDPQAWGHGMVGVDGVVSLWGRGWEKKPFIEADCNLTSGLTQITLKETCDWEYGDLVCIADSQQKFQNGKTSTRPKFGETLRVVQADGSNVLLLEPLKYDHPHYTHPVTQEVLRPHLALLSRGIVCRSENPNGVRGHIAFLDHDQVHCGGIEYVNLGRTLLFNPVTGAIAMPGNPVTNADGTITQPATQIGRYSCHFHHCLGVMDGDPSGLQWSLTGCSVRNDPKWGFTIHGTHYGKLLNSVAWNCGGAGVMFEDGVETKNTVEHCFFGNMDSPTKGVHGGATQGNWGIDGAGVWLKSPNNFVIDCVTAGCSGWAYNYNSYWNSNLRAVADVPGDHTLRTVPVIPMPVDGFNNNLGYGCLGGIWITWDGGTGNLSKYARRFWTNSDFWHCHQEGAIGYHTCLVTIRNCRFLYDVTVSNKNATNDVRNRNSRGIDFGTIAYENGGHEIIDCEVRGANYGILLPVFIADGRQNNIGTLVSGCTLSNYVNLVGQERAGVPHVVRLDNNDYEVNSGVINTAVTSTFIALQPKQETDLWIYKNPTGGLSFVHDVPFNPGRIVP